MTFCDDFFLDGEDVRHLSVVAFGPEVTTILGAHQLRRDPQPIARLANRPLEHGVDVELPADAPDVHVGLLHAERGGSRRDAQALYLAQRREELFGETVAEVLQILVGSEIGERQDGNRGSSWTPCVENHATRQRTSRRCRARAP